MAKDKSIRKWIWFVVIGSALIVVIGIIGSYLVVEERKLIDGDTILWEKAVAEDNIISYSNYLIHYPEGKHSSEAQKKIKDIEDGD